jgi:hypothetical protein
MARFDDLDDHYGWAHTLTSVGYVHRLQGHPEKALACFERALEALTSLGTFGEGRMCCGTSASPTESRPLG